MFKHILIPTDGSDLSNDAVQYAISLAKAVNAKVTGITVTTPFHIYAVNPEMLTDTPESYKKRMTATATKYLEQVMDAAQGRVGCDTVHVERSTKRVLSGWSVSPYRARRLPKTPRTRLASRKSSNASTASSAKRIRVHLPVRRGRTSNSNHSSSTWCRKMFERQGEITPPCGEPSVAWRRRPSSRTPAFSHLSIIRRITPSVTRWSRKSRRWECGIESKYFTMSISSTQRSL
jgi:hypothetical protein